MNVQTEKPNGAGEFSSASRPMLSEINVTPFVDVMLVLLIIFMVTAPMMQQGLNVQLPETEAQAAAVSKNPFILVIKKNGRIFIDTSLSTLRTSKIELMEVPLQQLGQKLKAVLSARKDKHIYIQADRLVSYGKVAAALAELQLAGLTKVSLITAVKKDKR